MATGVLLSLLTCKTVYGAGKRSASLSWQSILPCEGTNTAMAAFRLLNARLVLATTGLHLAQFCHKHRPLAKAVDYAEIFIYDEAQQEVSGLGGLSKKSALCLIGSPFTSDLRVNRCCRRSYPSLFVLWRPLSARLVFVSIFCSGSGVI